MKKNDFATFIAYLGMFGIAIAMGLGIIRNKLSGADLPINGVLLIIISALVGILLNSILVELGHIAGAKVGKYKILLVAILGLNFGLKDGKRKVFFKAYDGLTGQTKISPLDPKKSSPSAYIFFPVLFLLLEVIAFAILLVLAKSTSVLWLEIAIDTIFCIAAMIYFYNLFPARLDTPTDGYLAMLVGKPANKIAYNHLLLAEEAIANGETPKELPVYDDITDFTARLNSLSAYKMISEDRISEALAILDKTIQAESHITESTKNEAFALKLCLMLLSRDVTPAKELYDSIEDGQRKFVADILSYPALIDYMLISARLDNSFTETRFAYLKKEYVMKHTPVEEQEVCKKLDEIAMGIIKSCHPTWNLDEESSEE